MIYVDRLITCSGWKWRMGCHLYSDDKDPASLHRFAKSLGLRRVWFQDHPKLPHYDLTAGKRRLAIKLGAKESSLRRDWLLVANRNSRHTHEGV